MQTPTIPAIHLQRFSTVIWNLYVIAMFSQFVIIENNDKQISEFFL